jgi:hypothetical protein
VLDRMMAKDPARRFQTATEASRALVDALPTAARNRIRVPFRQRLTSMFYKSLLGLGLAGCLLFVAFVAGAAVVAYTVFSKPPKIAAQRPIPDSLAQRLRNRRALVAGDVVEYVYQPGGQEDTTLLVLTRRRLAVVTPRQVRSYSRDSIRTDWHPDFHGGLAFRLAIYNKQTKALAETVFRSLSFRDMVTLAPRLNDLEEDASGRRVRVRVRP